jgi:ferric-dicitrate binding protein FerR (iron transport regulator)
VSPLGEQLPERIIRTAIEWQMRLRANAGNAELHRQLNDWRCHDARHELAWQRLQQVGGLFKASQLPDATRTIPLLRHAEADLSRRRTLKMLGLGLAVGSATLLATTATPVWRSDFATTTGERRRVDLVAGTALMLNTGSAVDVLGRELLLRTGEVLVDGDQWRVRCRFGECEGRQARAVLRERDGSSEIHVEHGVVSVSTPFGQRSLQAGDGLGINATQMTMLSKGPLDPFAWARGLLIVNDIRLADFLSEAGRYRQGWLGCDNRVADLRLSGVFHLDEPAHLLRNITHLLPVHIVERTRWWVRIMPLA